ncbi:hypothetical protein C8Q73DRAFT_708348 [Cubamyces lactineus]|nr:hypothetical protein C8Q73DRAFT_708348 [Cubamyces lactineus]
MHPHFHYPHRCGRASARIFWFILGAGTATWWHCHHDAHAWQQARACWRDRIPQNAYPAPGSAFPGPVNGPPPSGEAAGPTPAQMQDQTQAQAQPQAHGQGQGTWERWGWGPWGRDARAQQQQQQDAHGRPGWGAWGARDNRPEGAWGPPMPVPGTFERPGQGEKDIVQQATDTITELSEATLNNLLVTVESLKAKLAEHRAQREQQERELKALREAKFKQFEEWQRQLQEQQAREEAAKAAAEPARRLV